MNMKKYRVQMTKASFLRILLAGPTMPTQQLVYALGLFNLTLAGVAVFCVAEAENRPEHFALVYVAISIFVFYMGTIFVIIVLQIIETYEERRTRHAALLEVSVPTLKATITTPTSTTVDQSLNVEDSSSAPSDMIGQSTSLTLLPELRATVGTSDVNEEPHPFKST